MTPRPLLNDWYTTTSMGESPCHIKVVKPEQHIVKSTHFSWEHVISQRVLWLFEDHLRLWVHSIKNSECLRRKGVQTFGEGAWVEGVEFDDFLWSHA